jgi:TonB family protein
MFLSTVEGWSRPFANLRQELNVTMYNAPYSGPFSLLPERRPPWKEFLFSFSSQGVAVFLLVWLAMVWPQRLQPNHEYHFVKLVDTPPPASHDLQSRRILKPQVAVVETPVEPALRLPPEVRPKVQRDDPPQAPKIELTSTKVQLPPSTPVIPHQPVRTNVFSTGSSEPATLAKAADKVQTGGFGDPNGVPANGDPRKAVTIAAAGSFNLPSGPGYGNGTGGAHGARGVTVSAGFGNGVTIADNRTSSHAAVRQSGFGDAEPIASTQLHRQQADAAPKLVPAEVTFKPLPVYTDEARKLRIEGEVLLEVVFESSGKLQILRVVRGLGHGLDEAAVRAAEKIRFKPAERDGQPTDSTAVLHIIFQIA